MNIFIEEFDKLEEGAKAFWINDVEPYINRFGAWGQSMLSAVIYDAKKAGQDTLNFLGAQMKQVFENARVTVGAVMKEIPTLGFGGVIEEAVRRMGFDSLLKTLAKATLTTFAHGFATMILAGVVSGSL